MILWNLKARLGMFGAVVFLALGSASLRVDAQQKAAPATYEVDIKASRVYIKVGTATRLGHEHGVEGNLKWERHGNQDVRNMMNRSIYEPVCDTMGDKVPARRPSAGACRAGEDFAWRRERTGRFF
jgi:hypothetical protein